MKSSVKVARHMIGCGKKLAAALCPRSKGTSKLENVPWPPRFPAAFDASASPGWPGPSAFHQLQLPSPAAMASLASAASPALADSGRSLGCPALRAVCEGREPRIQTGFEQRTKVLSAAPPPSLARNAKTGLPARRCATSGQRAGNPPTGFKGHTSRHCFN